MPGLHEWDRTLIRMECLPGICSKYHRSLAISCPSRASVGRTSMQSQPLREETGSDKPFEKKESDSRGGLERTFNPKRGTKRRGEQGQTFINPAYRAISRKRGCFPRDARNLKAMMFQELTER